MRKPAIIINGAVHQVRQRTDGTLVVAMNGVLGWNAIWGDSIETLAQRINLALRGKQ